MAENLFAFQDDGQGMIDNWLVWAALHFLALLVIILFTLMVTALFGFHTYLAMVNQTTWEAVSWQKISYLKKWPRQYGGPFSEGL